MASQENDNAGSGWNPGDVRDCLYSALPFCGACGLVSSSAGPGAYAGQWGSTMDFFVQHGSGT